MQAQRGSYPASHWDSGMKLPARQFYTKLEQPCQNEPGGEAWVGRERLWGLVVPSPHSSHMAWLSCWEPTACCGMALVGQGDMQLVQGRIRDLHQWEHRRNEYQVAKGRSQGSEIGEPQFTYHSQDHQRPAEQAGPERTRQLDMVVRNKDSGLPTHWLASSPISAT